MAGAQWEMSPCRSSHLPGLNGARVGRGRGVKGCNGNTTRFAPFIALNAIVKLRSNSDADFLSIHDLTVNLFPRAVFFNGRLFSLSIFQTTLRFLI